ncbi:MAG: oligosaccharide flippase family protein [Actinobacteria bacterium]|nr:oligosaccharide flippase family protein [Actinomycetota bacterium]
MTDATDDLQLADDPEADEGAREVLGMARGGALNLVGALFSQIAFFLITVLLARVLGRAQVGLYAQGFAFLSLLGLLSLSGFRAGLTRFVAVHLADDDPAALRGTVRLGLGLSAGGAAVLGAALWLAAPWLSHHFFSDPHLVTPFRYVGATLPASVFADAALSATQGYRTMKPYAYVGLLFEPGLRISLTALALWTNHGLRGAMIALTVSNYAGALAAAVALRRLMGRITEHPRYEPRELFGFSAVSWLASLASTGLIWADTIILGVYRSSAEVGVYQVATRLVMLAAFVMVPVNAAFAPRIADLHRRARTDNLRRTYAAATGWILRLSLPGTIACIALRHQLLELFGRRFVAGATVTLVLALGKLVDSATGPCGLMLNMSGRPVLSLVDNVGALVINVVLNLMLIPHFGITGSAYAWAISLTLVNVVRVVQVGFVLDMYPFDFGEAKAFVAGGIALLAGLIVAHKTHGLVALAVGGLAVGLMYIGVLSLLGIGADDQLVLQSLRPGRGAPAGDRP